MTRAGCSDTTVIIADAPWPHANGSRTNSGKSPKYPLMRVGDIADLGRLVAELAGRHAVLFLWVTSPYLMVAGSVIEAWGFRYRSAHIWKKARLACGWWNRSNHEACLVADRGRPAAPAQLIPSCFEAPPRERRHSSKPATLHDHVEKAWPAARKIELFARATRPGWETYGADIGTTITKEAIQ